MMTTYEALVRDQGPRPCDWIVMTTGSLRKVRTRIVVEAGMMASTGNYRVTELLPTWIRVEKRYSSEEYTEFQVREVTS